MPLELPWRRGPHLVPGARLGRYRVVRLLAVGGMAEIYLARLSGRAEGLRGFEKLVVIKRILPQHARNRNLVRMFLDEARLMATLNHPNIVQVHDVGSARGSFFFAMEHVHGEDLRALAKAAARRGQPVPFDLAMGIIAEAAAGLHHAHEQVGADGKPLAIVHRDVSPSNVLVSFDGAVKVTDFGVAKWARQESETRHGSLKGKLAYMSPEQARGEPLDRRSDVFALGILLYELLTGTRLFQGATEWAVLEQIVKGHIQPPSALRPDLPAPLERIVLRALARDRDRRHGSARDLQLALEAVAHEARLPLSPVNRARYVQQLFARKLAAWHEAEQAGRSLGQHLASLPDDEVMPGGGDPAAAGRGGTAPAASGRPRTRASGSASPRSDLTAVLGSSSRTGSRGSAAGLGRARRRRWVMIAGAGVTLAAAGVFGLVGAAGPAPTAEPTTPKATVAEAPATPPAPAPEQTPPEPTPPATVEPQPARRTETRRRPASRRVRATKAATPSPAAPDVPKAPAPPPAEKIKIWDPDSVFLPK